MVWMIGLRCSAGGLLVQLCLAALNKDGTVYTKRRRSGGDSVQELTITIGDARELLEAALSKTKCPPDDRASIIDHILRSEVNGHSSHGFLRMPKILDDLQSEQRSRELRKVGPALLELSGNGTQGIACISDLCRHTTALAETSGAAVGFSHGYVGTTGSLGIYAHQLALNGFVSISFCHSEYAVAPYGGADAILGTNPLCVGIPGPKRRPIIADLATSAWSYGALKEAMNAGVAVPEGVVQDVDGNPSTDPNDADNGSQLPLGGHKGYALGLAIELICGAVIGGKLGEKAKAGGDSFFLLQFPYDAVRNRSAVESDTASLLEEILRSRLAPGHKGIRIPGSQYLVDVENAQEITVQKSLLEAIASI